MRFKDRIDAGKQLANAVRQYESEDCVVYALPRGGVVLGDIVARQLSAPLDILVPRKVGHPYHPEYAIAAVSEDGTLIGSQSEIDTLDPSWLESEIANQQAEARRRREVYAGNRSLLSIEGKVAIVVDDGIATGLTMLAAIQELSARTPAKIVVAVPVVPQSVVANLKEYADEVIALTVPEKFAGAVGAYYDQFDQVQDSEVIELLNGKGPIDE